MILYTEFCYTWDNAFFCWELGVLFYFPWDMLCMCVVESIVCHWLWVAVVAFYNHYLGGNHIEVNAYKCSGIENEIFNENKFI